MSTTSHMSISPEFREAMARFPSGVTVVTTRDERHKPYGFTASSFCSVSLDPPLVLVCLDRSANSYQVFTRCGYFAVSILQQSHQEVAQQFATRNTDKFTDGRFTLTPRELPAVEGALCVLDCAVRDRHAAGDHMILVGQVDHVRANDGEPMVYFSRGFHRLTTAR